MKKGLTELVFILDRSGSMSGLEGDTIGGYNSMLEKQKKEKGEAVISTVLFDTEISLIHDRQDIKAAEPLNDKIYYTKGCTALLDAIGGAVKHIGKVHKELPEDERPEKTLFIITTDGLENASRTYTYDKVKKMVEKKKDKKGWEFIFLGANMDAIDVAHKFGVSESRAATFHSDGCGQSLNYSAMSTMISGVRGSKSAAAMGCFIDDLKSSIEDDYADYEACMKEDALEPDRSAENVEAVKAHFGELTKREQSLVELLYGLNGNEVHTYEEVGRKVNMDVGRARQLDKKVLKNVG